MADSDHTRTQPTPAPDDMHWGINYLREDIQDIRAEARESRAEVKAEFVEVRKEFVEVGKEFAEVRKEMAALRESLLKHIDSRFYWAVGLMATMMGMQTALTAALIKL